MKKTCDRCTTVFDGDRCRVCANKAAAIYRANNREKMAAASKKWQLENSEKYKASLSNYKANNVAKINAARRIRSTLNRPQINRAKRAWYGRNAKRIRADLRAKYAADPAKALESIKAWKANNREKVAGWVSRWRESNPDKVRAIRSRWYRDNREAYVIYSQNRRSRLRAVGGQLSTGLAAKLLRQQKGKCACCMKPLGRRFHLDHIMPLALGGRNEDSNMQLLRPLCNLQKAAKHPNDFMRQRGFLL